MSTLLDELEKRSTKWFTPDLESFFEDTAAAFAKAVMEIERLTKERDAALIRAMKAEADAARILRMYQSLRSKIREVADSVEYE